MTSELPADPFNPEDWVDLVGPVGWAYNVLREENLDE